MKNKFSKKLKTKKMNKNKKSNKKTNKKNLKGGDIDLFYKNFDSAIEIGKGAAGVVYLDKKQPNTVFKISYKDKVCRMWDREYKIYQKLNTFDIDEPNCKLVKMIQYKNDNIKCAMELTRSFNPLSETQNYAIHPQFGEEDFEGFTEGRGLFIGINQLIKNKIFTENNIKKYVKELALVISRLHYKIKNDGYDLELFISREPENSNIIIYVSDFDLTEFITEYNDEVIARLEWSLSAVPYFPTPDQPKLFKIFKTNYINEADKYGLKLIAEKVIELY